MAGLEKFYQRSYGLSAAPKGLLSAGGKRPAKKAARKYVRKKAVARPRRVGRRGWRGDMYGHAVAAKIGWGYRKYASSLRGLYAHAARPTKRGKQKGLTISERSLRAYRKARSLSERRLESRRRWYTETKRKSPRRTYSMAMTKAKRRWGSLYNRRRKGRGASAYQRFVSKFIRSRRVRGVRGARGAMRAAAAAWRRGGRRRVAANPVLPYMAYDNKSVYRTRSGKYGKRGYRKLHRISGGGWHANRKRRKTRRNPLYRTASGRFARRGGHKLRRYKGGGWRSNPVLPMAVQMNRRRRRGGRRYGYRSNGVLPYMAYSNPLEAVTGTVTKLTDVDLWTKTILPIAGGFIGTRIVSYQAVKLIAGAKFGTDIKFDGIVKHGATLGSSVLLSAGVGIVTKDTDMAAKVLAGGLVAFLGGLLDDLLGADYKKLSGMGDFSSLADDLTDELKARIAEGVKTQIEAGGQVSSFVTQQDLNVAPRLGDFMTSQALKQATVREGGPVQPGTGRPEGNALADLSTFQDAMADGSLI
jgi:hypothetical protein